MVPRILRKPEVKDLTGIKANSTFHLRINQRLITSPIALGAKSVGWPEHEIAALNAARIAGQSDDEIRALVVKLEAARKQAFSLLAEAA